MISKCLPDGFDYVMTMEDLTHGQRFANYSVEFQRFSTQFMYEIHGQILLFLGL